MTTQELTAEPKTNTTKDLETFFRTNKPTQILLSLYDLAEAFDSVEINTSDLPGFEYFLMDCVGQMEDCLNQIKLSARKKQAARIAYSFHSRIHSRTYVT